MDLTGGALPYVLAFAAVVVFLAVAFGLPHVRRRRGQIVVRVGQTVLLNLLVLALAGVLLNDQYLFYVSWSDLLGTGAAGSNQLANGDAGAGANVKVRSGLSAHQGALPPLPSPGQREQTYTVTGKASGITAQIVVWLPEGYNSKASNPYPVIEAMAGYPGSPRSNFHGFELKTAFDDLVRQQHVIRPPVIVMPQINTPTSLDTECVNSPLPGGLQTETWLSTDVANWTVAHFRVATNRDSWVAMGFSYGAWCATMLSMHHPQLYAGAISLMGYFRPEFTVDYDPLGPHIGRYNLASLARTAPPPVSLFLMASKDDSTAYPQLGSFLRAVRSPMSATTVVLRSGGHRIDTIPPVLPAMLTWLGASLSGFRV